MPKVAQAVLFQRFEDGLTAGGWQWLRGAGSGLPRPYRIWRDGETLTLNVYLWTLTGGGRGIAGEWRIQRTGTSQFERPPGTTTVILGFEPEREVFAGFSFAARSGPLGKKSPSIQIRELALDIASEVGIAAHQKVNEVAFALRPELLGSYICYADALHAVGTAATEATLLAQILVDPTVDPAAIDAAVVSPARRTALKAMQLTLRDSRFRRRVLSAYAHACAACGVQLGLLDAAHILPFVHAESTDEVSNGVALCSLHHRAYDGALLTFDKALNFHVSEQRISHLTAAGRLGGLPAFKAGLLKSLTIPSAVAHQPSPTMIFKANRHRGWSL